MKNFALLLAFSTSAAFVAVACGDSDSGGDDAKGGSSGSSGASGASGSAGSGVGGTTGGSAGTPATGGSAGTPTGGSAGAATGGSAGTDGGEGGVGAEGGVSGDAGGGPGPGTACPESQPMAMSMCTSRGLSCDFGDTVCRCAIATGNWQCFDQNPDCPAMPSDGDTCMGTMTACSYGEDGTCVCQNPMGPPPDPQWLCDAGLVTCPATDPMDGSDCTDFPADFECGDCTCGTGMNRTWDCGGGMSMCPAMAPDSMDPCQIPGLICEYMTPGPGADAICVCNLDGEWQCL